MRVLWHERFLAICFVLICAGSVRAYWQPEGNQVSTYGVPGYGQELLAIIPDDDGCAIVLFRSYSNPYYNIYIQKIHADGDRLWTDSGIWLAQQGESPAIVSDDAGGAVITWGVSSSIRAQRINASGQILWGPDGILVNYTNSSSPIIAQDGAGGAIIPWYDYRNGAEDIYAQRVNAAGTALWTYNGVAICTSPQQQYLSGIEADGFGGALIIWRDYRSGSGNPDLYAQRVDQDGLTFWAPNGVAASTAAGSRYSASVGAPGDGGAFLVWEELASPAESDIYVQKLSAAGMPLWTAHGRPLCDALGERHNPILLMDPLGNALITWRDLRDGSGKGYCQKLSMAGIESWGDDGLLICSDDGEFRPIPDSNGGAIIAWPATVDVGEYCILAQRVSYLGEIEWASSGVKIRESDAYLETVRLAQDGQGGAYVVWSESQSGAGARLFIQSADSLGRIGKLAGEIHSVIDVPGDQGGQVYLSWDASPLDVNQDADMSHYTLWRAINADRANMLVQDGALQLTSVRDARPDIPSGSVLMERTGYYWELVGMQDAYYLESYAMTIPTLFDSTAACTDMHYFQVITHSTDPHMFWISLPDSGYSVDNLAPAVPRNLAGEADHDQGGLLLAWAANSEADIAQYHVYRGPDPDFIPQPANLIGITIEPSYFDDDWDLGCGCYYKVSAIDVHLNESDFALLDPGVVTPAGEGMPSARFRLSQNFPNPFNPCTEISFVLPIDTPALLRIYDGAGRLLRILPVSASHGSDELHVTWDGRDDAGSRLPGGVYFCELVAGQYRATSKMVLLN